MISFYIFCGPSFKIFDRIYVLRVIFSLHFVFSKEATLGGFTETFYFLDRKIKQDCSYQGEALNVPTAF